MKPLLRIGTRKSPLALRQVELVREALVARYPELDAPGMVQVSPIVTVGDKFLDFTLDAIGGKGLFTKEIEQSLLDDRIDIAVHSVKDMQTALPDELMLAAVLEREDPRDVLIAHDRIGLQQLPPGAIVGTSSLRRGVQVKRHRDDVGIRPIRGNIQTRMKKIEDGEYDATLLALAGLKRMGVTPLPGVILEIADMLPAVGQGIIGIECRKDDRRIRDMLASINHQPTMTATRAERAMLKSLDGSCRTPIAGYATLSGDTLHLQGMLAGDDMQHTAFIALNGNSNAPEALGEKVAAVLRQEMQ